MAELQRAHPPAARVEGRGGAGARVRRAHARDDQVFPVEDGVHRAPHQGHDGGRGHQTDEVKGVLWVFNYTD